MCVSQGAYYLVTGSADGIISVFELGKPGKERFAKEIATFQGMPGVLSALFIIDIVQGVTMER